MRVLTIVLDSQPPMNAPGLNEFLTLPAPSGFDARANPVWLWSTDGTRVLWASRAALVVSGARTLGALTGQIFGASTPAVMRMAELGRTLGPAAPPRLERLRFFFGARSEMLTCLVKLAPLRDGGHGLLVAAMGLRVVVPDAVDAGEAEQQPAPSAPSGPEPAAAGERAPASEPAALEDVRPAWLDEPADARRPVRFTWSSDEQGRLTLLSPAFTAVTGLATDPRIGLAWPDALPLLDAAEAERLRGFLSMTETWSAVSVAWRPSGSDLVAPLELSGVPIFDLDRVFGGFRGFGVFRLDAAREEPQVLPTDELPTTEVSEAEVLEAETAEAELHQSEVPETDVPETNVPETDVPRSTQPSAPVATLVPVAAEPAEQASANADDMPPAQPAALRPIEELTTVIAAQFGAPKVVPLRAGPPPENAGEASALSDVERVAFREIARTLAQRVAPDAAVSTAAVTAFAPEPASAPQAIATPSPEPTEDRSEPHVVPAHAAPHATQDARPEPGSADPATPASRLALPILERLPLAVLVLRGDEPLFANRALLELAGYPDMATFREERGQDRLFQGRFGETLADASPLVVVATRTGEKAPVEAWVQTVDWDGRAATLMTLRRAAELENQPSAAALEEEAAAHRAEADEAIAMLDIATDGVVALDHRGRILSLNRAAEALFGFDQKEVAGEPFTLLLSPESHPAANEYMAGLRGDGVAAVLNDGREIMGRERKGGRMPLFMALGRVNDAVEPKYAAVLRDITQWKRAEAELIDARRQSDRANAHKSDFLAKVSHEIRTPLNAIIGFAELMMEERLGPIGTERYKEYLADINTSGRHVMSLIDDLLDLSKIEAGRMELTFTSVDLNAMVASCVSIMQPQANRDRVIMRSHLANRLPRVVADERSVRQIVLNLLSNATKFTDAGGQVIVSTTLTDRGEAAVRVRDTGVGMNEKEAEQALEPFRRIATAHPRGGTGLGLPLTKALAEANRAKLSLRSRPNEGTLVELTFPAARVLAE